MIPVSILTGFLGAGKTTLLNKIIEQNKNLRFGLIVNEFGEVGIDGQILETSGEEIVEMSNGCVCCIVRKDLQDAVLKLVDSGRVDYVFIETSGLAEPLPVAQTFAMEDLGGKVKLDAVICVVDAVNFRVTEKTYRIALEQLAYCDIIIVNKAQELNENELEELHSALKIANPHAVQIVNKGNIDTTVLIETGKWSDEKLTSQTEELHEHEHEHEHHHHEHEEHGHDDEHGHHKHEHEEVDEVVFTTKKALNPNKLDTWLSKKFPENVVRAKGFLQLQTPQGSNWFLFQMVGAAKKLEPFNNPKKDFNYSLSRMVLIGKNINKNEILENLAQTEVE